MSDALQLADVVTVLGATMVPIFGARWLINGGAVCSNPDERSAGTTPGYAHCNWTYSGGGGGGGGN